MCGTAPWPRRRGGQLRTGGRIQRRAFRSAGAGPDGLGRVSDFRQIGEIFLSFWLRTCSRTGETPKNSAFSAGTAVALRVPQTAWPAAALTSLALPEGPAGRASVFLAALPGGAADTAATALAQTPAAWPMPHRQAHKGLSVARAERRRGFSFWSS